ncbi:type II restriction enzyme [Nitratiruptor sp. YY09-18]|nr:BsaWI family type II restriction enzyme [Nitratiruptor sp. YY09-18]BCD68620.1 type II restriction enzyme [Nitratiruptor sp. YY09-18]
MIERFKHFKNNTENPYKKISDFLENEKRRFYELGKKDGKTENEIRQGWVSYVGHNLETIFEEMIKDFCTNKGYKITKDKILKGKELSPELSEVKRKISVNFGEYMLLPDADIVIYTTDPIWVKAILSIKNSFRERYTETPYWKLKLLQDKITEDIKVFMITPDKDNEISFKTSQRGPRKARIVMEYELDGIYLAKEDFEGSDKVKSIENLFDDLEKLL